MVCVTIQNDHQPPRMTILVPALMTSSRLWEDVQSSEMVDVVGMRGEEPGVL